ncbi:carboxypeptidase-like regulatory domain-containing protein [Bernardetia sp. OM2101]|uniref:carboxypeptidase-like regulatory domain-containing protein n=1 Tax=Bernardetia sp. OM2101 TaxID=3344876 RepID=UPI0035CF1558
MKVNLPEPCHEDWNKMDSQEKGRFCGSCQKLVIDFSVMSDIEIINYFKEYKGQNTCGHFKKTQIDRKLKEQETPRKKIFLKELAAACFAFFVASTEAKAQGGAIYTDEEVAEIKQQRAERKAIENQGKEIAINGKIVNGKKTLSNASISIKGTEHKTVSLENGLFSMYIPFELAQNQKTVTLVVKYEGLESKEVEVTTSPTNQFIEIDLAVNMEAIIEALSGRVGGIVVDFEQERTITGTVKDETGQFLPSATVQIKGTQQGVLTDSVGNYSITVPKDAVLTFHFIGFASQEITVEKIKKNESVDVVLTEHFLGELVIVRKWYSPRGAWYKIKNLFR